MSKKMWVLTFLLVLAGAIVGLFIGLLEGGIYSILEKIGTQIGILLRMFT